MSNYVNQGDYSYWRDVKAIKDFDGNPVPVDRDLYVNGGSMHNVIFPANPVKDYEGDIVPIGDYAGRQFAYAWWRDSKNPEDRIVFGRLRADGYEIASTENFKVVRETFYTDGGRIYFGDTVLMACPAEKWEVVQRKKAEFEAKRTGQALDKVDADFANTVAAASRETGIKLEPIAQTKSVGGKRK